MKSFYCIFGEFKIYLRFLGLLKLDSLKYASGTKIKASKKPTKTFMNDFKVFFRFCEEFGMKQTIYNSNLIFKKLLIAKLMFFLTSYMRLCELLTNSVSLK